LSIIRLFFLNIIYTYNMYIIRCPDDKLFELRREKEEAEAEAKKAEAEAEAAEQKQKKQKKKNLWKYIY
jgi:hypothetical protein